MRGASVCGGLDFWGASVCRGLVFPGGYCSWGASVSEPTDSQTEIKVFYCAFSAH